MSESSEKAKKILRKLFLLANGDAADTIKKYQGTKLPGFGIMYPELKKFAGQFNLSNEVACELIEKNTREARIVALLLFEPEKLNSESIIKIQSKCETNELQNLFARHTIAPILKRMDILDLQKFISVNVLIKGIVQRYRITKIPGGFSETLYLLLKQAISADINFTDGQNLVEMLYCEYPEKRKELKADLQKIAPLEPHIQTFIKDWISSFDFIEC